MTSPECPQYDSCNAPICPLDAGNARHAWFPDEDICSCRNLPDGSPKPEWVEAQRKIARATKDPDRGYFTIRMLQATYKVGKGIRGVDPDSGREEEAIATWISKRKPPVVLSEERRSELAARCKGFRERGGLRSRADSPSHDPRGFPDVSEGAASGAASSAPSESLNSDSQNPPEKGGSHPALTS